MRKLLLILSLGMSGISFGQTNTWDRLELAGNENRFNRMKDSSNTEKYLVKDSEGATWYVYGRTLVRNKAGQITNYENFPISDSVQYYSSEITIDKNDVINFTYIANNGLKPYIGQYDAEGLKFYPQLASHYSLYGARDHISTERFYWVSYADHILRFDKSSKTLANYTTNPAIIDFRPSRLHIIIPGELTVEDNSVNSSLNRFNEETNTWSKVPLNDAIKERVVLESPQKHLLILGNKGLYQYNLSGLSTLHTFDSTGFGPYFGKHFYKENLVVFNYMKGVLIYDKGIVTKVLYPIDTFTNYNTDSYQNTSGYLILTVTQSLGKIYYAYKNGVCKLELRRKNGLASWHHTYFFKDSEDKFTLLEAPSSDLITGPEHELKMIGENDSSKVLMPFDVNYIYGLYMDRDSIWAYTSGKPPVCKMKRGTYMVKGNIYYDNNANGIKEATELPYSNTVLTINPSGITVYPASNGNFFFAGSPTQSYTVQIKNPEIYSFTSKPLPWVLNNSENNVFGLKKKVENPEASMHIDFGRTRCNTATVNYLPIANIGVAAIEKVTLKIFASPLVTISDTIGTLVNPEALVFNKTNLLPGQSMQFAYKIVWPTEEHMGKSIPFKAVLDLYKDGSIFSTVIDSISPVLRCAYDPNDKAVSPPGVYDQHYTLKFSTLDYLIRFENTGNDTAYNITVHDELDSDLDVSTFSLKGSSHPVNVQLKDGKIRFDFDNIMLPDSKTDKINGQGYVRFSIKAKEGIAENTLVKNIAHIVFDSNPDIITNETFNTMVTRIPEPLGLESSPMKPFHSVFPNPAHHYIATSLENVMKLEVSNLQGQVLLSGQDNKVNVENVPPGIYLLTGFDSSGKIVVKEKFIKK